MAGRFLTALASNGVVLTDAAIWLRDHELIHAICDYKDARGVALPLDVWLNLSEYLNRAVPYLDTGNNTLIYVFDLPGVTGKVVIRVNYLNKVRDGGTRKNITSNFIVTGGVIGETDIGESRYIMLQEVP